MSLSSCNFAIPNMRKETIVRLEKCRAQRRRTTFQQERTECYFVPNIHWTEQQMLRLKGEHTAEKEAQQRLEQCLRLIHTLFHILLEYRWQLVRIRHHWYL